MPGILVSISIPADVETVWDDVARLETHVEWMADAESIEFIGDTQRGVGATMKVLTKIGPLQTTDLIRIVAWEPPRRMGVVHEGVVTGTGEFRLDPDPEGTRFVWEEKLSFPWYLGGPVAATAARPILTWVWRRNLARLAARFR